MKKMSCHKGMLYLLCNVGPTAVQAVPVSIWAVCTPNMLARP